MNILYFVNRFPKLSESFIINEIHELEKRGHNIAVFSLRKPEIDMSHDEVSDLTAEIGYLPDPGVRSLLAVPGRWCLDENVLRSMVHRSGPKAHVGAAYIAGHCIEFVESLDFQIDHVHGHFLNWPKLAAQYTAKRFDVPCTVTAHAYDLYSNPDLRMLRRLADRLDRVVTISEYNKRYLEEEVGTEMPVDVVHMGIDLEKFQPTDETVENRILTVGRFVEKKGITYGIKAVAEVVKEVPDLEYHIIGSGPKEDEIRATIAEHDLEHHVTILGNVTDEELIQKYGEAQVFLLPCVVAADGDRDGIPVVLMEAMAMECVPVSTRVSGIPELIEDGENGYLCKPRNLAEYSSKIKDALDLDSREFHRNARNKIIEDFKVCTKATELIQSLKLTLKQIP